MKQYLDLARLVLEIGRPRQDRTGTGTLSVFSPLAMAFNLEAGFPLVTTRKLAWRNMAHELIWMLSGSTDVNDLPEAARHWWSLWADDFGKLGPTYGKQLRRCEGAIGYRCDQISRLEKEIKNCPESRRLVLSTWNAADVDYCRLPPCHGLVTQFYVDNERLHCKTYQRSADVFIGLPYNIGSYALLTYMLASVTGLKPGWLHYDIGDAHIYKNHILQMEEQLTRTPKGLPGLLLAAGRRSILEFRAGDIDVVGYEPHPAIHAEVSV